ncbi:MAG: hypothetical protein LKE29_02705 [Acidaminococcaceae bacterium]|nr:hypothetical protein [Acidaminococcaceae bacterium]
MTNTVNAQVTGSTVKASNVTVKAFDGTLAKEKGETTPEAANANLARLEEEGYDVNGTEALSNANGAKGSDVEVKEDSLGQDDVKNKDAYTAGTFKAKDNSGSLLVTSAVGLALNTSGQGTVTAGGAVVYNKITNDYVAEISGNSNITANGGTGVTVNANTDTLMVGVGAGAAASKGTSGVAAAGSVSYQDLNNTTKAKLENSTVTADTTNITAGNASKLINVTGQVSFSSGYAGSRFGFIY